MSDFSLDEVRSVLEDTEPQELALFATAEEKEIAARLLPTVVTKAMEAAEAKKAKELTAEVDTLRKANAEMIQRELEKIREEHKPLTPEEIEKLISQEYLTIAVKLHVGRRNKQEKEFIVGELPQKTELEFAKAFTKTIAPIASQLTKDDFKTKSHAELFTFAMNAIPEFAEAIADMAAVALDPFQEEGVTKEWVQQNVSTNRIWHIIEAQLKVNRLRDFISAVSRSIPGTTTL
jgi:endonuclease III